MARHLCYDIFIKILHFRILNKNSNITIKTYVLTYFMVRHLGCDIFIYESALIYFVHS